MPDGDAPAPPEENGRALRSRPDARGRRLPLRAVVGQPKTLETLCEHRQDTPAFQHAYSQPARPEEQLRRPRARDALGRTPAGPDAAAYPHGGGRLWKDAPGPGGCP